MLVRIISFKFESATCYDILKPYLIVDAELSHLSWKPRPLGSFSLKNFHSYLLQQSTTYYLNIRLSLYFYYANLGPNNIMVLEESNVKDILN